MDSEHGTADQHAAKMANIDRFAQIIVERRKIAIDARKASGVEEQWQEDQDYYDGIDEHNRPASMEKPSTSTGVLQSNRAANTGSNVFMKITSPYVDAASARVADMLLPTDDRNFALRPTPIAGLIDPEKMLADTPALPPPQMAQAMPNMQAMPQPAQPMPGMMQPPVPAQDEQAQKLREYEEAKKRCEMAQRVIDDWQTETNYHHEVRKVIENASRLGTGILKGPVPIKKRRKAYLKDDTGTFSVQIEEKTIPASFSIDPRNFYPDPNCGEDIQDGSWTFEKDTLSARKLRELKGGDYLDDNIDQCLKEGPMNAVLGQDKPDDNYTPTAKDKFQIWYFHGYVDIETMESAGCDCEGAIKEQYPCTVTIVNNRIIKIVMSPLDGGEFPYDVMRWKSKPDCWYGEGIARQGRECQRGINSAVRNLMDNAGLSAGPQIIVDTSRIEPANGQWEIKPRKVWRKKQDGEDMSDVRSAFTVITIETRQVELLNIIQFFLKQMEDVTGMPMLMQGQQGKAPDTVGGMTILNNNGNTVLRRITRMFDYITECHQNRYYEWLLLYGPDEAKGDFTVDARGSSALMERDLQNQAIAQLTGMALNPAFGLDPELVMEENIKGLRLDPKKLQLSAEKKQMMAQQGPPPDPRLQIAEMNQQMKMQELELKDLHFNTEMEIKGAEADKEREFELTMKHMDMQLAGESLSAAERKTLNDAKVLLANSSMKLRVQRELSEKSMAQAKDSEVANHMVNLHKGRQALTPLTEPTGRAPDGQAFHA